MSNNYQFTLTKFTKRYLAFLTLAISFSAFGQQPANIRGKVTSADSHETLSGVSVIVKGSTSGTSSNSDGEYSINASPNDSLVFTYIGFDEEHVAVGNRTTIDIALHNTGIGLSEVVVTALGIRREERSLTYAVQSIKGDQSNKAKETNVINSLQGKVAGVTITKNATGPGGDSKVLIRGNRSITNSNEPLYVIDGVPLAGNVSMLSSDDIETMTVLK